MPVGDNQDYEQGFYDACMLIQSYSNQLREEKE
ncbi:hypothetical protein THIOSC13_1910007 [uncultured Thiomicrorhabdus sp.]